MSHEGINKLKPAMTTVEYNNFMLETFKNTIVPLNASYIMLSNEAANEFLEEIRKEEERKKNLPWKDLISL